MVQHKTGITRNGIEEKCRWDKPSLCPRHIIHTPKGVKNTFTVITLDEPDYSNPETITLQEYNETFEPANLDDLNEEQKQALNRFTYLKLDDKFYRKNNNKYTLDSFRYVNSCEEFTEDEFNQLLKHTNITIDEVTYMIDEYGELTIEHKDVDAPYMRLEGWFVDSVGMNIPEYVKQYGNKNQTLDYNVEQAYMNGGCAVYALALKELNPSYEIAVETFGEDNNITYNHVFCINPVTGEAYDARGRFTSPEHLYDYSKDPLTPSNPTMTGKSSHTIWDMETLYDFINEGFFTYDDTKEDIFLTKQLIQNFKPRFP